MIYTGRQVHAEEAHRIGLVNAVHPLDQLMPAAQRDGGSHRQEQPGRGPRVQEPDWLGFTGDQAAGLAAEVASFGAAFAAPDRSEGMRAFVEKRAAEFAGEH